MYTVPDHLLFKCPHFTSLLQAGVPTEPGPVVAHGCPGCWLLESTCPHVHSTYDDRTAGPWRPSLVAEEAAPGYRGGWRSGLVGWLPTGR